MATENITIEMVKKHGANRQVSGSNDFISCTEVCTYSREPVMLRLIY